MWRTRLLYAYCKAGASRVATKTRQLYRSANGDRWYLVREIDSGRVFIKHEANEPSGGQVTEIEIGDFLITGGRGPEHTELLRLIGTLVEARSDA
jgi:hypothetical protein